MALTSNRDLQKAIADIEAARAQYGETRASLFPTVDAELSHTRSKTVASGLTSSAEADGAVSSFELDLFGKNQSLSRAARETWLASEYTAQNTRLTMIADLTTAWVTLAADNSNLALAQQTLASAENSRKIVARQMAVAPLPRATSAMPKAFTSRRVPASPAIAPRWRRTKMRSIYWPVKPSPTVCCPAPWKASATTAFAWYRPAYPRRCCSAARIFRRQSII